MTNLITILTVVFVTVPTWGNSKELSDSIPFLNQICKRSEFDIVRDSKGKITGRNLKSFGTETKDIVITLSSSNTQLDLRAPIRRSAVRYDQNPHDQAIFSGTLLSRHNDGEKVSFSASHSSSSEVRSETLRHMSGGSRGQYFEHDKIEINARSLRLTRYSKTTLNPMLERPMKMNTMLTKKQIANLKELDLSGAYDQTISEGAEVIHCTLPQNLDARINAFYKSVEQQNHQKLKDRAALNKIVQDIQRHKRNQ